MKQNIPRVKAAGLIDPCAPGEWLHSTLSAGELLETGAFHEIPCCLVALKLWIAINLVHLQKPKIVYQCETQK